MYHRILVPLDGSATAQRGFHEAVTLARRLDASLVLVHVVEWFPMVAEMTTATSWDQVTGGLREAGRELLDRAHDQARELGVAAEAHLLESGAARVADTIVDTARGHQCDLIVMGTHGRRGLTHALVGSDAEAVLRLSPVPVLMVRHAEAASG